mmetsp:Transcript_21109/g.43385  ORF Transcript_21109/g.43385 Transcript_21109/m.43385 type:complete len:161 (-) Transcript_21109:1255-1737(-)
MLFFTVLVLVSVVVDDIGVGVGVGVDSTASTSSSTTTTSSSSTGGGSGSVFDSLASCWQLRPVLSRTDRRSRADKNSNSNNKNSDGVVVAGTCVDFRVEMTVSDPVTIAVLNRVLHNVAESQVEAFHERCKVLPPPTPTELAVAERFYNPRNNHHNHERN